MVSFMSPKINISEIDLTTIVPSVSTTIGATAGVFSWGPAFEANLVTSQEDLLKQYQKPNANNAETWWNSSNFLDYANKLYVSRAVDANALNAVCGQSTPDPVQICNQSDFQTIGPTLSGNYFFVAKYPGALGNSLRVGVCQSAAQFRSALQSDDVANNKVEFVFKTGTWYCNVIVTNLAGNVGQATSQANTIKQQIVASDVITYGGNYYATNGTLVSVKRPVNQVANVASVGSINSINSSAVYFQINFNAKVNPYETNTAAHTWTSSRVTRNWKYASYFSSQPRTSKYVADAGGAGDQMHVIVFDQDGGFTGTPGTVLEKYENLSRATDAKSEQGEDIYWMNFINKASSYVWGVNPIWGNPDTTSANMTVSTDKTPLVGDFVGGTDGANETNINMGVLRLAWDVYKKPEEIDISILLAGKAKGGTDYEATTNYLIDEIAEVRKDCIVVASPPKTAVVNNFDDPLDQVLLWRDSVNESSYAVLDSGYKYQYDKFNDAFWWVPLNGDIGGLIARTDLLRDAWWSPGGFVRGDIKNVTKLSWNPDEPDRDLLYVQGVNPVITVAGEGTYLFGDKTAQARPSAFDRINVRRLFIVLEKAIAKAAKYTLFEFNDEFTRAQFKNMVDPYLRDIQGRRGIQDFLVVCDESNNTGEVIDRNEFVADIYVKPARSINFIQLNFVAVRTSVSFEEIVGRF